MSEQRAHDHWEYSQVTSKICHVYFAIFYLIFYEWHYLDDQSLAQFGLGGQFPTGLAVRMDDVLVVAYPVVLIVLPIVRRLTGVFVDMSHLNPPQ